MKLVIESNWIWFRWSKFTQKRAQSTGNYTERLFVRKKSRPKIRSDAKVRAIFRKKVYFVKDFYVKWCVKDESILLLQKNSWKNIFLSNQRCHQKHISRWSLNFEANILQFWSTHEYFKTPKYELQTPTRNMFLINE